MKIKTFTTSSAKQLDRKVNAFLADPTIEVLRVHFSASTFGVSALVEYESPTG